MMSASTLNAVRKTHLATVVASPNSLFRKMVLQELAARNCCAEEVSGGAEALAMVEDGTCRKLLIDRNLPDLDAEELVALIRARHPHIEVTMIDSQADNCVLVDDIDLPTDSN
jgi:DNA-binding NtrC family response regulator